MLWVLAFEKKKIVSSQLPQSRAERRAPEYRQRCLWPGAGRRGGDGEHGQAPVSRGCWWPQEHTALTPVFRTGRGLLGSLVAAASVFAQVLTLGSTFRGCLGVLPAVNCHVMMLAQTMFSLVADTLLLPSQLWWSSTGSMGLNPAGAGPGGLHPHSWVGISGKPQDRNPSRSLADFFRQPSEAGPATARSRGPGSWCTKGEARGCLFRLLNLCLYNTSSGKEFAPQNLPSAVLCHLLGGLRGDVFWCVKHSLVGLCVLVQRTLEQHRD